MKENQTIAQFLGITTFPYRIKNEQGNIIYSETSDGYWWKREFDANGNETRYETTEGYWEKSEYDADGYRIYYQDSTGKIRDNRPKQTELTLSDIATKLNIPLDQLRIKE